MALKIEEPKTYHTKMGHTNDYFPVLLYRGRPWYRKGSKLIPPRVETHANLRAPLGPVLPDWIGPLASPLNSSRKVNQVRLRE